jgi:leucyl/phenylalanyl-tRNA--protein transferase
MNKQLPWLEDEHTPLPPSHLAWGPGSPAPGLLAGGGSPTVARLEEAYRRGIFPWYSLQDPVLWWSPNPRMVLFPGEFKLHRSLRQVLKRWASRHDGEVRIDFDFDAVISACAHTPREGQGGTWIVPEMLAAYRSWHRAGRVHSVEVWEQGRLIGGLYGVGIGRMFYGESMFSLASNASKIALAALVCVAREHGIGLIDCQQRTPHLASLGAREISRESFEAELAPLMRLPDIDDWRFHPSLWRHLLANGAAEPSPGMGAS